MYSHTKAQTRKAYTLRIRKFAAVIFINPLKRKIDVYLIRSNAHSMRAFVKLCYSNNFNTIYEFDIPKGVRMIPVRS